MTRWLDRDGVADRLSVRVHEIPRLLRGGKLPEPSYHLGPRSPRWDCEAVDAMMAGTAPSRPEAIKQGAIDAIIQEANRQKGPRGRHG